MVTLGVLVCNGKVSFHSSFCQQIWYQHSVYKIKCIFCVSLCTYSEKGLTFQ